VDWIEREGPAKIEAREAGLTARFLDGVEAVGEVTVYGAREAAGRLPVISLNVNGMTANNVGTLLDVKFGIATRTGLHCAPRVHQQLGTVPRKGAVRFSMGAFNTEGDVDACLSALRDIAARHGRG
jgi:selenocysteine lyase/cysteine desulfurase